MTIYNINNSPIHHHHPQQAEPPKKGNEGDNPRLALIFKRLALIFSHKAIPESSIQAKKGVETRRRAEKVFAPESAKEDNSKKDSHQKSDTLQVFKKLKFQLQKLLMLLEAKASSEVIDVAIDEISLEDIRTYLRQSPNIIDAILQLLTEIEALLIQSASSKK